LAQKKIDVIIPAYHAHSTLPRTLASIAMQNNADELTVYVCNDAGGDNYTEICDSFRAFIDIDELTLPINGGCGVARQFGIDRSHAPYFICQDADDTFGSAFALGNLLRAMESDKNNVVIAGVFVEETYEGKFVSHQNDTIFMHAKLYKRSFIDKYGIRFNETRANEDYGFNTLCRLVASQDEKIVSTQDVTHFWHYKHDSITREKDHDYIHNKAVIGMIDNMTWAIKRAQAIAPKKEKVTDYWAVKTLAEIYCYYLHVLTFAPQYGAQSLERAKRYYAEVYADVATRVKREAENRVWQDVIETRAGMLKELSAPVPFTIYEFINQIKPEEVKA